METWKIINDSNLTTYEISTCGNVRNYKTMRPLKINKSGEYSRITLNKKSYFLHRLIALTFIDNPLNKLTVNHIDKNKHNNNVTNLEWATYLEQYTHSYTNNKNNNKGVWKINPNTNEKIEYYSTIKDAGLKINGNPNSCKNISACARGIINIAYGYKWKYNNYEELVNEIWKSVDIKDKQKQNYYISNYGRIRNNSRLLKLRIDNNGYFSINNIYVHRIVAIAFIPNPHNYSIVNHIDGNKLNNTINNLEWTTSSGNSIHSVINGLRKNVKKIEQIDGSGNVIEIFNSCLEAAKKLNVNCRSINKCCKRELKSCGINKLQFRYKDNNHKSTVDKDMAQSKKRNIKQINIYNRDNKLIDSCVSITETSKKYNVNSKTIVSHCEGIVKYSKLDYYFRYK
jgi:hypothetical protein